jgi:hypothetical protein
MVAVHAKCNVLHVVVEQFLWNEQPMCCVEKSIVPLGERFVFEGGIL